MTKLAVIYYSSTGTIHAMAQRLAEAGEKAGGFVTLRATRAILHVVDRPH